MMRNHYLVDVPILGSPIENIENIIVDGTDLYHRLVKSDSHEDSIDNSSQ